MLVALAAATAALQPAPISLHARASALAVARPHVLTTMSGAAAAATLPSDLAPPPVQIPSLHFNVKGEKLTLYGVLMGAAVFFFAILAQIPVFTTYLWSTQFDKKRRRLVDWCIHFWGKFSMLACGFKPEVVGLENLPPGNCLYVPNHTSFMDILTMTAFIPRSVEVAALSHDSRRGACAFCFVFALRALTTDQRAPPPPPPPGGVTRGARRPMKYVSKAQILKIPFIGWPMRLAGHIALRTESRRSQLQTFKDTVQSLKDGNSVITFPEGTRARDGRLKPFKRGPFKMAVQAKVPIVPVTISGLARWYPAGTLLPITVPKGVKLVIHPPLETASGDEEALLRKAYATINDELLPYQKAPDGQEPVAQGA